MKFTYHRETSADVFRCAVTVTLAALSLSLGSVSAADVDVSVKFPDSNPWGRELTSHDFSNQLELRGVDDWGLTGSRGWCRREWERKVGRKDDVS